MIMIHFVPELSRKPDRIYARHRHSLYEKNSKKQTGRQTDRQSDMWSRFVNENAKSKSVPRNIGAGFVVYHAGMGNRIFPFFRFFSRFFPGFTVFPPFF